MPGQLTKLFSLPHFSRRDDACWTVFMTYSSCEKAAKTRLDKMGIENYLPIVNAPRDGAGGEKTRLQILNTIFARCDLRRHPGLATPRNFVYEPVHHAASHENEVLTIMESCWRIEMLSAKYPVEGIRMNTVPGEEVTLRSGGLSGSTGNYDVANGAFYLPLPERGFYAKIALPKTSVMK